MSRLGPLHEPYLRWIKARKSNRPCFELAWRYKTKNGGAKTSDVVAVVTKEDRCEMWRWESFNFTQTFLGWRSTAEYAKHSAESALGLRGKF